MIWFTAPEIYRCEGLKLVALGHFCPFTPRKTKKIKILKKWKKIAGDIILHMRTKNHNQMMNSSWDTEWHRQNFRHFGPYFALLPSKSKFWENEKSTWRCHHFTNAYQKSQSYNACFQCNRQICQPRKLKFWKNNKKMHGDIIILHMCTINDDMTHDSWDMECDRQNFLSSLLPPSNP